MNHGCCHPERLQLTFRHSINSRSEGTCHSNAASLSRQERGKVGARDHHWSCFWVSHCHLLTPCHQVGLSGALLLPKSLLLLPGPTARPRFGAEWAPLSHETGTAPCKGRWRLSWGGSGGAQQCWDRHKQVLGGGSVLWSQCVKRFLKYTLEVCSHLHLRALWGEKCASGESKDSGGGF